MFSETGTWYGGVRNGMRAEWSAGGMVCGGGGGGGVTGNVVEVTFRQNSFLVI